MVPPSPPAGRLRKRSLADCEGLEGAAAPTRSRRRAVADGINEIVVGWTDGDGARPTPVLEHDKDGERAMRARFRAEHHAEDILGKFLTSQCNNAGVTRESSRRAPLMPNDAESSQRGGTRCPSSRIGGLKRSRGPRGSVSAQQPRDTSGNDEVGGGKEATAFSSRAPAGAKGTDTFVRSTAESQGTPSSLQPCTGGRFELANQPEEQQGQCAPASGIGERGDGPASVGVSSSGRFGLDSPASRQGMQFPGRLGTRGTTPGGDPTGSSTCPADQPRPSAPGSDDAPGGGPAFARSPMERQGASLPLPPPLDPAPSGHLR